KPGPAAALHRQRRLLARGDPGFHPLLQDVQPRLPGLGPWHGLHRLDRPDPDAALRRTVAEVPAGRAGPWRTPATGSGPRAGGHLLRPAADLVRAVRRRPGGPGGVPAACDHPAADVHVPRVGLAERLAAPDR